ncbi:MAG: hypothetical protein IPL47_04295 [Phyllobacteriaceae bacterium]|nr:hypothetical protein [Phyllobacteriaceae bacterium]
MAHQKRSRELSSVPAMHSAHISLADLDGAWIGVGAALEWIAMRGQAIPASEYDQRSDAAAEAFITTLADMMPEIAESLVRGQPESGPGSALCRHTGRDLVGHCGPRPVCGEQIIPAFGDR